MFRRVRQVPAPGAKLAVYDCLFTDMLPFGANLSAFCALLADSQTARQRPRQVGNRTEETVALYNQLTTFNFGLS